jgi:pimeloyl-ACP methyl ester carboxylesterase
LGRLPLFFKTFAVIFSPATGDPQFQGGTHEERRCGQHRDMKSDPSFLLGDGERPAVICLHSTGSSSRQWARLTQRLSPRFRMVAVDLIAHGRSRPWGRSEAPSIEAELDALSPLLEAQPGVVHLVGHSYGGAVALRLAMRHPARITSVAAFEPVMFRQLLDAGPHDEAALEAVRVAGSIHGSLAAGRDEEAARFFYDYWSGTGAWIALDEKVRQAITERMPAALACFQALFADRTPREAIERLRVPVLLMSGGRSPASGRATTKLLARLLPKSWWHSFEELGHMGPVDAPEVVNPAIARFLDAAHRRSVAFRPRDTGGFLGRGAGTMA